jgi:hypothetical protein
MHILLKDLLNEIKTQQDTPQFKNWFKNSAVVDSSGKPLRVYHGTSSNFDIFNTKLRGAWFAEDPREASAYTASWKPGSYFKNNAHVLPVYLSIQNPKIYSEEEYEDFINKWVDKRSYKKDFKAIVSALRTEGYDGLVFKSYIPNKTVYVVFEPTQIKSAISNNGDFDPSNPDTTK